MADPRWRQIAEDLRQKIEAGEIGLGGAALPTELELQDLYGASRNTVRDAIKWLETRGLVSKSSGRGTFVAQRIDPFVTVLQPAEPEGESTAFAFAVRNRSRTPDLSVPRVEVQQAARVAPVVVTELRLQPDAHIVSRHQSRLIDGVPYSLQTTFYPMEFVQQGAVRLIQAEDIDEGAVHYLEALLGFKEAGRRDRFAVRAPDANETSFFSLPDDGRIGVFELVRTGFDESGKPFRVTVTTLPTDRNQFVIESGLVPEFGPEVAMAQDAPVAHAS